MANESQTPQKTDEQLFNEVSEALAKGESIDSLMNVEVTDTAPIEEPVPEEASEDSEEVEDKTPEEDKKVADTKAHDTVPDEDWEADLDPKVKDQVKKLKDELAQRDHKIKSELGRVPALQRQVEELKRSLSVPRATPAPKPEAAADKTSAAKSKFDEKLARVKEIDPDLADLLVSLKEDVEGPLRKEFSDGLTKAQAESQRKEEEAIFDREYTKLVSLVPQAPQVFKHPLYKQWKSSQSEYVQQLAGSLYADDVVIALEQFAKYTQQYHPELAGTSAPAATTEGTAPVADASATKVAQDRARKLSAGAPSTTATAPKTGKGIPGEDDPEALFNYVVGKLQKGEALKL